MRTTALRMRRQVEAKRCRVDEADGSWYGRGPRARLTVETSVDR